MEKDQEKKENVFNNQKLVFLSMHLYLLQEQILNFEDQYRSFLYKLTWECTFCFWVSGFTKSLRTSPNVFQFRKFSDPKRESMLAPRHFSKSSRRMLFLVKFFSSGAFFVRFIYYLCFSVPFFPFLSCLKCFLWPILFLFLEVRRKKEETNVRSHFIQQ